MLQDISELLSTIDGIFLAFRGVIALISIVVIIWSMVLLLRLMYMSVRAQIFVRPLTQEEVTAGVVQKPAQYEAVAASFASVGLYPLRIVRETYNLSPKRVENYVFVSDDGTIYAEVLFDFIGSVFASTSSFFPDDSMFFTRFPFGERVETPNFSSAFVRGGIETMVEYHRRRLPVWSAQHGAPRVVQSIADLEAVRQIYRQRYRVLDSRNPRRYDLSLIFALLGMIVCASGSLLSALSGDNALTVIWAIATMISGAAASRIANWVGKQFTNGRGALDDAFAPAV